MTKICKGCLIEKEYSFFTRSKNVIDGYENKCKVCRADARRIHVNTCVRCASVFKTASKKVKYCSPACRPQAQKDRVEVSCYICRKTKEITRSQKTRSSHHYCSDKCKNEGYSVHHSGINSVHYNTIKFSCAVCGEVSERWSSQLEKYEVSYCSKKCLGTDYKVRFSGENSPTYDNSKSEFDRVNNRNIVGYPEWRRSVFERDGYTCTCCGDDKGGNLIAHHLLNYTEHPELRTNLSNGVTACKDCHKSFHDTYGYRNNDEEQFKSFVKEYNTSKKPVPQ